MRPLGVTLIAAWRFLWGGLWLLLGLLVIVAGGVASKFLSMATSGTGLERLVTGLGVLVGLLIICYSLIGLAAAWGVWSLKHWGRVLCIALSALFLLVSFPVIFHPHPFRLVLVLIDAATIVYLLMGDVKAKFA
jgi:uncharacterized membrane protein (DUF2068 family)